MASDPVLSRHELIAFCERGVETYRNVWPKSSEMFRAIAQALQEDEHNGEVVFTPRQMDVIQRDWVLKSQASDAALVPRLRELLQRFVDKLDIILPKVDGIIAFNTLRSGRQTYDGPNLVEEMREAKELLAARVREGA